MSTLRRRQLSSSRREILTDNNQSEWNASYQNRDNIVFYPHEEVIRFVSKYIRKRVGLDEYRDVLTVHRTLRMLDLGCGIGRHALYCQSMGTDSYGIDLSETAIEVAIEWATRCGMDDPRRKLRQGDIRQLPWEDGFFDYAISHGVLDSMPLAVARVGVTEMARTLTAGGLFYCDLISADPSHHSPGYVGEDVVATAHERGTVQSYFDLGKIHGMIDGLFEIVECILVQRQGITNVTHASRYHLVLRKKA